jgi:DNA invertase Pin-like site-specific DNA recombinase
VALLRFSFPILEIIFSIAYSVNGFQECTRTARPWSESAEVSMKIGYARVSTDEQNLDLQRDALRVAGCEKVFEDRASGAAAHRPGLEAALSDLREGDCLVIWKLDRLGRTVKGLVDLVHGLERRGVQFQSMTDGIDTTTPAGRFFFHVMSGLAQMERELIAERTRAGLAAARARGRLGGRKRKMTDSKVVSARNLLASGTPPAEVAKNLGVSVPTLYRWVPAGASIATDRDPASGAADQH